jgi:hypothetical protein
MHRYSESARLGHVAARGRRARVHRKTGRPIQVRRYLMGRTQHWLYLRVKTNVLEVLSVWSAARRSTPASGLRVRHAEAEVLRKGREVAVGMQKR